MNLGKCEYIEVERKNLSIQFMMCSQHEGGCEKKIFWTVGFCVPLVIIVISYFMIWRTSLKSSAFLKTKTLGWRCTRYEKTSRFDW